MESGEKQMAHGQSGDVDPEAWKHGITRRSGSNKRKTVTRL